MEEMTFEEFSREVNNIYKKNCEVYYKLASHFGMTENYVRYSVFCSGK